jgi:hypothetical protein
MSENNTSLEETEPQTEIQSEQPEPMNTQAEAQAGPEQQLQGTPMPIDQVQKMAFCNWCRNPLDLSGTDFSESNFVDTDKQWHGQTAQAVYCNDCLKDDFRKSQPKSVINRVTLDETNIENLP